MRRDRGRAPVATLAAGAAGDEEKGIEMTDRTYTIYAELVIGKHGERAGRRVYSTRSLPEAEGFVREWNRARAGVSQACIVEGGAETAKRSA